MDIEDTVYYLIAVQALHTAIEELPPDERSVLVLVCLGYPVTSIAQVLQVGRSTVWRRCRRALPHLRESLERKGITECPC